MTCHYPDLGSACSFWLVEANFLCSTTNQKLGSDISSVWIFALLPQTSFRGESQWWLREMLQSRTKLLEKVYPIMSTFVRNKTISKTTPLRKENLFPQFNVASHKRPGIRLSFEYTTTLLSGEGEREEPVQPRCLEKCCPSIEFSQQFCPRL